ncbi:hypothetical protein RSAG8_10896, partial [Rhizoctonia solani AG-8 WAC10335]
MSTTKPRRDSPQEKFDAILAKMLEVGFTLDKFLYRLFGEFTKAELKPKLPLLSDILKALSLARKASLRPKHCIGYLRTFQQHSNPAVQVVKNSASTTGTNSSEHKVEIRSNAIQRNPAREKARSGTVQTIPERPNCHKRSPEGPIGLSNPNQDWMDPIHYDKSEAALEQCLLQKLVHCRAGKLLQGAAYHPTSALGAFVP